MFHNQRRLTELILNDPKLREKVLVFLESNSSDKIILTFKNEMDYDYVTIENLKNLSMKKDDYKIFNYVVNIIRFVGNLCLGNNVLAIQEFKKIYSLNVCVKIVTNSLLSSELRSAFVHLIHHMWFKSGEKIQMNKSIFFCKVWDEIEKESSTKVEHSPLLRELWIYVSSFLNDTKKMWDIKMFGKTDFEFLKSLLQLTSDLLLDDVLKREEIVFLANLLQDMLFCKFQEDLSLKQIDEKQMADLVACKVLLIDTFEVIQSFQFSQFIQSLLSKVKLHVNALERKVRIKDNEEEDPDSSRQPALERSNKNLIEDDAPPKSVSNSGRISLRDSIKRVDSLGYLCVTQVRIQKQT